MRHVVLPGGGTPTTAIGFGTAGMAAGSSIRESIARLEAAYDAGIRHFDTAPTYGLGGAEAVLGTFLRSHPDASVTTKVGEGRPSVASAQLMGSMRALAKKTVARIPGVKARLVSASSTIHGLARKPPLTPATVMQSLHRSLGDLQRERIDILLLHEISRSAAPDDVIEALDGAVAAGKIGAWGVGGRAEVVASYGAGVPRVIQTNWSIVSPTGPPATACQIVYGSISSAFPVIDAHLREHGLFDRWSSTVGADLRLPEVLAGLLLRAALDAYPAGIALFTSRSPDRAAACTAQAQGVSSAMVEALVSLVVGEPLTAYRTAPPVAR